MNQTTVNTLPPEDTLPPEMWSRIIKTAIASTPAQDIQGWKHLSGNLLVSHQFKALTERLPEYKLLKYILPILQKKTEGLLSDYFFLLPFGDESDINYFFYKLNLITPGFCPVLLGLINSKTRAALVKTANVIVDNIKNKRLMLRVKCFLNDPIGYKKAWLKIEISHLYQISHLLQASIYSSPSKLAELRAIRIDINPNKLINELVQEWNLPLYGDNYDQLSDMLSALTYALAAQPVERQLQNIFEFVKTHPTDFFKINILKILSQRMPFLLEQQRNELVDLTIAIAQAEIASDRKISSALILFREVINHTKHLRAKKLAGLVGFFFLLGANTAGRTELLCGLVNAAQHLDERLRPILIDNLRGSKADTLESRIYRALQIRKLSKEQRAELCKEIRAVKDRNEKAFLLGLLCGQLRHLQPEDCKNVLNDVQTLPHGSAKYTALCEAAAHIGFLSNENSEDLLKNIQALPAPYACAEALIALVNGVTARMRVTLAT